MNRQEDRRRGYRDSRAIAVMVIAVCIAPAVLAWIVWGDGSNPRVAAMPVTVPDVEPRRPYLVRAPIPIVPPPGRPELNEQGLPKYVHSLGAISTDELRLATAAGMVRVHAMTSRNGEIFYSVVRYTARDGVNPEIAFDRFSVFFDGNGWHRDSWAGARIWRSPETDSFAAARAYYVRGRELIQLHTHGSEPDLVEKASTQLIREQLERYPADE